jgi:thiosulfate dehydrogenase
MSEKSALIMIVAVFFILLLLAIYFLPHQNKIKNTAKTSFTGKDTTWNPPDTSSLAHDSVGNLIRYGRELIVHTAKYFGPKGSVAQISNGMNCDNCHINGGTTIFANDFAVTSSTYPKFRKRSNSMENLAKRIDGCFERSLNGIPPGDSSREMKAMIAYINWVGQNAHTENVFGTATEKLPFLSRAADTLKGKDIFVAQCSVCHGRNGEGKFLEGGREYLYPPLWGKHSYNNGAGLYQLSQFAGFVKNNMPFGTSYKKPYLSNEQAWDVAAYINSRPRPVFRDLLKDWPDIAGKPADYPFGPYVDSFPENQHKYGPFDPIVSVEKNYKKQKEDLSKK